MFASLLGGVFEATRVISSRVDRRRSGFGCAVRALVTMCRPPGSLSGSLRLPTHGCRNVPHSGCAMTSGAWPCQAGRIGGFHAMQRRFKQRAADNFQEVRESDNAKRDAAEAAELLVCLASEHHINQIEVICRRREI